MLKVLAEKFRYCIRALVVTVGVLAVMLTATTGAFASNSDNLLIKSAFHGEIAEVERLLASGADIDHLDANGVTALFMASGIGHGSVVEELLRLGAGQ